MQRKWYRSVLEKDIDAVNGLTGKKEGKTRLMNMVMQVRLPKLLSHFPKLIIPSYAKSHAIHTSSMGPNLVHHTQPTNTLSKILEK